MNQNKLRKIIIIVLAVIFAAALCGALIHEINYYRGSKSYNKAASMINLPSAAVPETETEAEIEIEPETEEEPEPETEPETEPEPETETETEPETETETETETEPETETETETETAAETETEPAETEPETDSFAEEFLLTDISSLQEVNDDVFGWIIIPDTSVSYPLLQGDDNSHYLTYAWDLWWNPVGSIFLDYRNARDLSDFHSIIYGHRMYDDSMFNSLKYYNDAEYFKEHPYVYILNGEGVQRYTVFSAYTAETDSPSWRLGLEKPKDQQLLIDYYIQHSEVDAGIRPLAEDGARVLTLSTCSRAGASENRWVVHCVLSFELPKTGK